MKTTPVLRALALVLTLTSTALHAQVPQIINYQGRVAVGDPPVNFDGSGSFKFALVQGEGPTLLWNNPLFPASCPANGSFNGLHPKSKFLAAAALINTMLESRLFKAAVQNIPIQ